MMSPYEKTEDVAQPDSEEWYRLLLKNAHDMIFVYEVTENGYGKFLDVNDKICTTLGYTKEELLEMNVRDIEVPEQDEQIPAILKDLSINHHVTFETDYFTKNGNRVPVEISAALFNLQGRQTVFAIVRNITGSKQAKEALRETNKKINLLTSIIRHDINNQLTVLNGYLHILEMKQPNPSLNEYFQKASTAAESISTMIQFTKEYENLGVNSPVWQDTRTLVDIVAKKAPLGKVMVKNDLPAGTELFADPLIVKVFYNLMDNAMQHGKNITTIRFSLQAAGDEQVIVCEINGVGVPVDEKARIFERGIKKNTDFGLTFARVILSITGISISETGEPGKGVRFEMRVPNEAWRFAVKGD